MWFTTEDSIDADDDVFGEEEHVDPKPQYSISANLVCLKDVLRKLDEDGVHAFSNLGLDEHGIARCGIFDTGNFSIWGTTMPFLSKIPGIGSTLTRLGPTFVVTDKMMFMKFIANLDKNADYAGNPSVEAIRKQVGSANVFATPERKQHQDKRLQIKSHFSKELLDCLPPLVNAFFQHRVKMGEHVRVHDFLNDLIVKVFAQFISGIVTSVDEVTPIEEQIRDLILDFQDETADIIKFVPKKTRVDKTGLDWTTLANLESEDTITLMKVGFGNIHSMLSSLIYRLAQNYDATQPQLKAEVVDGRLPVNLNQDTVATRLFFATYQLAPPVWLLARKVGDHPLTVKVRSTKVADDEQVNKDKEEEITLQPHTLVLAPFFHMLRMRYGNNFDLHKFTLEEMKTFFPYPFSMGCNSCVGRFLAIPLIELVLANMLNYHVKLESASDKYIGAVALRFAESPMISFN